MLQFIKVTSLAVAIVMCSACGNTDTVSSEPSSPAKKTVSAQPENPDTQAFKSEVKTTQAEKAKGNETRSAESHTHGDASLAVVVEGSKVIVELETPLYNLVGFEHAAETEKQKAAVIKAESVLSGGAPLFMFNVEAGCDAPDISGSVKLDIDHDHTKNDTHNEGDIEDNHDPDAHKDVVLQYEYICSSPKALKNVTVMLFEYFENLTELDLVYLAPNTQKQGDLSAAKPRMDLTR